MRFYNHSGPSGYYHILPTSSTPIVSVDGVLRISSLFGSHVATRLWPEWWFTQPVGLPWSLPVSRIIMSTAPPDMCENHKNSEINCLPAGSFLHQQYFPFAQETLLARHCSNSMVLSDPRMSCVDQRCPHRWRPQQCLAMRRMRLVGGSVQHHCRRVCMRSSLDKLSLLSFSSSCCRRRHDHHQQQHHHIITSSTQSGQICGTGWYEHVVFRSLKHIHHRLVVFKALNSFNNLQCVNLKLHNSKKIWLESTQDPSFKNLRCPYKWNIDIHGCFQK